MELKSYVKGIIITKEVYDQVFTISKECIIPGDIISIVYGYHKMEIKISDEDSLYLVMDRFNRWFKRIGFETVMKERVDSAAENE